MKTILVDPSLCIQCTNCQISCKDEHADNDWTPIAAPQAKGQFWIRIDERETGSGSRMRLERTPVLCQHCENAPCIAACPNNAIYTRPDGIVIIDPVACKGCGTCRAACPYDAVFENPQLGISQKCTMCAHLLDEGWDAPRCVRGCPTDALQYVDVESMNQRDLPAPLERLMPDEETNPRVAYIRTHKPFVAGGVISPKEGKALDGACVTATHQVTGSFYRTQTDTYGDFTVNAIEPGFYTIEVLIDGYYPRVFTDYDLREAKNMGEVRLYPKA